MKAGFVYERLGFTEDSDPIHDMGIGRIRLIDDWERIYRPAIEEYRSFIEGLIGKTLTGVFDGGSGHFTKDATVAFTTSSHERVITVKVAAVQMYFDGGVKVTTPEGVEYRMNSNREYKIE